MHVKGDHRGAARDQGVNQVGVDRSRPIPRKGRQTELFAGAAVHGDHDDVARWRDAAANLEHPGQADGLLESAARGRQTKENTR